MGPAGHEGVLGHRLRSERRQERRGKRLEDLAITKRTREAYYRGAKRLVAVLRSAADEEDIDEKVSQWIEKQWRLGGALFEINAALCGLQHYLPSTRKRPNHSWRLFRVWRRVETPVRAPPLPEKVAYSITHFAVEEGNLGFAAMIMFGFEGLLRTGEFLSLRPMDVLCRQNQVLIHLSQTKTTGRKAASEVVHINHPWACEVIETAKEVAESRSGKFAPIWSTSQQHFRAVFRRYLQIFRLHHLSFRPYSLRRGGATELFIRTQSFDSAIQKGRWQSTKAARVYIQDALSKLPLLALSNEQLCMVDKWYPL